MINEKQISATAGDIPVVKLKKLTSENPINTEDKKLKRLATEKHPTIEAITNSLFRFEKFEQALARLEAVKNYFILSNKLPKDEDENTIKLWIRGYQIDADEEKQGYLGNYAAIKVKEIDGKFTLTADKQRIALKYHPQRKRPKRKHPDWGHPALRVVRKGTTFETIEEAQKILGQIHEEYPDISIPNTNKLFVIIYSKALNMTPPVQKFILEIKASRDGGFFIEYKANNYKKNETPMTAVAAKDKEKEERKAQGHFTSKVMLQKAKKDARKKKKTDKK